MTVKVDGAKVRELREDLLYSQRELARHTGLAHETIHRIEVGEGTEVLGATVRKLAAGLEVDPHDLLLEAEAGKALAPTSSPDDADQERRAVGKDLTLLWNVEVVAREVADLVMERVRRGEEDDDAIRAAAVQLAKERSVA